MPPQSAAAERRRALRAFKQRGYAVHVNALEAVLTAYRGSEYDDLNDFLSHVFEHLSRAGATSDAIVSASVAAEAAAHVARRDAARAVRALQIIDAFSVPGGGGALAGAPDAKAALFRERYELVRGQTMRNERFTPPASGLLAANAGANAYLQLTGVESLPGARGSRLVLGMLAQMEEGVWYLEDIHGNVRVDVSKARVTAGLHTECSFVVAHGELDEEEAAAVFRVAAMGTPPLENREDSVAAIGSAVNLFGGTYNAAEVADLVKREQEEEDAMILLLSDVHLDSVRVIGGLRHVLQGYLDDGVVPTVIVLMGAFLSRPFGQLPGDVELLASKFSDLGTMIADDFPQVAKETNFVFVPGANDPGPGNVLPRPALPSVVTRGFTEAVGKDRAHFGTNPCRLRYMSQEIVLFREDLMHLMVRHCVVKPDMHESQLLSEHLIKSVVDQAHLCPLPLTARPVVWNHDRAMWLFPLPHVVCIADKVDTYVCKYGGTLGLNPGSFASHFSFITYLPAERRAQQCSIDSEHKNVESEQDSEPVSHDEDDYDGDSDSGRSVLSLLRAKRGGKDDSDHDDLSDRDIDITEALAADVNMAPAKVQMETGPVMSDSENETGDGADVQESEAKTNEDSDIQKDVNVESANVENANVENANVENANLENGKQGDANQEEANQEGASQKGTNQEASMEATTDVPVDATLDDKGSE